MGMNYYYRSEICKCCSRYNSVHLGKSSAGWAFSFKGDEQIRSYADWLHTLEAGGVIVDEAGAEISLKDFKAKVEAKKNDRKGSVDPSREDQWEDAEGHPFCDYEYC